ncbi:MAG: hypothetical protein PHN84_14470 [Desulfuromonadaceae bacterium]|nr:hypothetical protein [Desulfuromonadaceae bacterium]MDD2856788.1 hypothetical protein [Desulfuromonadaceae bacterium]
MSGKQNNNLPASRPSSHPPDPELIGLFLKNQTKELEIREQELVLRKQADNNSFQFAQKSLDAQVTDRTAEREHVTKNRIYLMYFAAFVIVAVVGFLGFALHNGKDAIAMEIIKAILYIVTGSSGGYALGRSKKRDSDGASQNE